jgi:hypothetical protein
MTNLNNALKINNIFLTKNKINGQEYVQQVPDNHQLTLLQRLQLFVQNKNNYQGPYHTRKFQSNPVDKIYKINSLIYWT